MRRSYLLLFVSTLQWGCFRPTPGFCLTDEQCQVDGNVAWCDMPKRKCVAGKRPDPPPRCTSHMDCPAGQKLCYIPRDESEGDCVDVVVQAELSGAQAIPPTCSPTQLSFLGALSPDADELIYTLRHPSNMPKLALDTSSVLGIEIREGMPGTAGLAPVFTLDRMADHGRIAISSDQQVALVGGIYYVSIQTRTFPLGELRGQIYKIDPQPIPDPMTFYALLAGTLAAPVPNKSDARGYAEVVIDEKKGEVRYNIQHDLQSVVEGIHVHRGGFNMSDDHIIDFPPTSVSPTSGTMERSALFMRYQKTWPIFFKSGLAYLNIHTSSVKTGEIRGQLLPNRALPFNVLLEASQIVPIPPTTAASGKAEFFLNEEGTKLTFRLGHTATDVTSAELFVGARGTNGTRVACTAQMAGLGDGKDGVQGTCDVALSGMNALSLTNLKADLIYVLIKTGANPNGELRGQIRFPKMPLTRT